jgi:cation diffusion facilitator CzcD-associated flavoprotein CzcO
VVKSSSAGTFPKRVCIIGAGSSGITAAKAMVDAGISFDCFERGSHVGGNWVYKNDNGLSACYESLHINTTTQIMAYHDHPMPASLPAYPNHYQIKRYFDDYVDHFGLRQRITFNTSVKHAERLPDKRWRITLDNGEQRDYDKLVVANGHHWDPRWPEPAFAGKFDGAQIHSHSYCNPTDPVDMQGKRVLIVGMGNSAMDIACELSRIGVARKVFLSARRGVWIMPKFVAGRAIAGNTPPFMPWWLQSILFMPILKLVAGAPQDFGLPKPNHIFLRAHPTISQEIYGRIGSGDVTPKPDIRKLLGDRVEFADGSTDAIDVIIYCTGYKISFPFFDATTLSAPNNDIRLWNHMVKPDIDNLYFVGLFQPIGAVMPMAERQSKLIAAHIDGRLQFPTPTQMQADIDRDWNSMQRRYVKSVRHTIQVDAEPYMRRLKKIASSAGLFVP